jgi:hypothetical protein
MVLKVLGALVDWLGVVKTLQLFGWGRTLLDTWRKTKTKVLGEKK